jgi:hypothetical protein
MRMRKIFGFTAAAMLVYGSVLAQKIPVEFSVGVGGYFPHDGRYSQFFDHNPASWSLQGVYKWSALDLKAGFDNVRKSANGGDQFSRTTTYPPDAVLVDSFKTTFTATGVKSYVRASTFRFGAAFHPFRTAAVSPFIGFGGGVTSTKGFGDSVLVAYDSVYITSSSTPDRVDTLPAVRSSVAPFSESVFGTYLEAGVQAQLPYDFFFIFEAVRDFRPKDKAGILGPGKGGGTLIGMRLGYRF